MLALLRFSSASSCACCALHKRAIQSRPAAELSEAPAPTSAARASTSAAARSSTIVKLPSVPATASRASIRCLTSSRAPSMISALLTASWIMLAKFFVCFLLCFGMGKDFGFLSFLVVFLAWMQLSLRHSTCARTNLKMHRAASSCRWRSATLSCSSRLRASTSGGSRRNQGRICRRSCPSSSHRPALAAAAAELRKIQLQGRAGAAVEGPAVQARRSCRRRT
mmetsp:Transcript_14023/g.30782  ORF Transcript_14023/g.30782 Transcript_14023/m.30782 type:complete len:223 (-) Transcript_14023:2293-2961(-)